MEPQTRPDRTWPTLVHISSFSWVFTGVGLFLGPLLIWLARRDQDAEVDEHGKEALNFNVSVAIYFVVSCVLLVTVILIPLVLLFWLALVGFHTVFTIVAATKANNGESFRYPFSLKLIK